MSIGSVGLGVYLLHEPCSHEIEERTRTGGQRVRPSLDALDREREPLAVGQPLRAQTLRDEELGQDRHAQPGFDHSTSLVEMRMFWTMQLFAPM